jgi:uncharacterized protein (DUF58 family)
VNAAKVGLLAFVVLIAAEVSGWSVLDTLFFVLVGVLIVAYVWSKFSLRSLALTRETRTDRAQVGQTLDERLSIENRSRIAKLWLEVRDHSTLPGHASAASQVTHLPGGQKHHWRVRTRCTQRGKFTIGPITLRGGDPFGLFPAQRVIPQTSDLIVYPATVDVSSFVVNVGDLPGGAATQRRTHYVTPNASGVREYMWGDSFNRIAWSTTARTGRLMVKEFELDPTTDVWVLVDLHKPVHQVAPPAQPGVPEPVDEWAVSTEETSITIAASIMQHFIEQGRNVGLVARGMHSEIVNADRGERQVLKMLEALSVVHADGDRELQEVLTAEAVRFGRNSALVVVTPSADEGWVAGLLPLVYRGIKAVGVIVDPSTFGAPRSTYRVVTSLTAANVPVYLVRRGEEIGRALSHPIGLSDAAPPVARPAPEPPAARPAREEVRGGVPVQQPAAP